MARFNAHKTARIIAASGLLLLAMAVCAQAATKDWPFDTPGNYVYDSTKIDVAGSLADLITQGWYDDCYQYRREIVLDNSAGGAETDFQVLVQLDSSSFDFASADAGGLDIRFTDSDKKTPISFWRESYDNASQTARFWVEIPTLNAAATQSIWIYYGYTCGAAVDASAYTDVFFHVGEVGTMSQDPMDTVWDNVAFTQAFDVQPVVVSSIQTAVDSPLATDNTTSPLGNNCGSSDGFADGTAVPIVRNVNVNGFDMNSMTKSIDCDGVHGVETIGWLAMEEGTYYVGDKLFRVFRQNMTANPAETFATINFGHTFPDVPVVLPQVQTYNNTATNSIRMRNGTVNNVDAKIEGESDGTTFPNVESVGFIVADQAGTDDEFGANLSDGDLEGEVGSTPEGAMEHIWHSTSFVHTFIFPPIVILKTQNDNGGNNGHERLQNISATGFEQKFSENFYAQSNSYDGNHFNDEGGAFIAIGTSSLLGWQYRRAYRITNASGQNLTDFTYKLDLTAANFNFANAKADGSDIRFLDAGTMSFLSYWYDPATYDNVGQTATFYLKIASLPSGGTYDFYMYYGNPGAADASDYTSAFTFVGESGVTADSVTQAWYAQNFAGAYTAPPVTYAVMNRFDGADPAHTRTRNVTNTGFETKIEESVDKDGNHTGESVGYVALISGNWVIGGKLFQAWYQNNVDEQYDTVSYPIPWPGAHGVFSKQVTDNNVFTTTGAAGNGSSHTRIKSNNNNNFRLQVERCDNDESTNLANETMSVISAETGIGDSTLNLGLEVVNTTRDNNWNTYNFTETFTGAPAVGVQIISEGGGASGESTHIRIQSVGSASFQYRLEEYFGADGAHAAEDVSILAVDQGLIYGREYVDTYPTTATNGAEENLGGGGSGQLIYARKYAANEPTSAVGASQEYNLDPGIYPVAVQGAAFQEVTSFTETLGAGTGSVQYQISNDGAAWFYWSGASWVVSDLSYAQSNTAATINANVAQFDNDQGEGTFYFRAILHAPTENDDISLDNVRIDYTVPPPAPDIFNITPNPGIIGGSVTITGDDFGPNQAPVGGKVYFNGCDAGVAASWSNASITIDVPTCATNGPVTVFANGYLSNEFNWTIAVPSITFLDPASGDFYQLVWIYGDNFGNVQGNSYVTFQSGLFAQVLSWSNNAIRVVVPSGAVSGNVEVTTAGGTSNGVLFNITPDQSRWPFTYDVRYSYDPALITVTGGQAELRPINVPSWYDRRWLYRRLITVNNATGGPLTDFVVELNLDASNFSFAKARANGEDIRLTTVDGVTFQNFWVESWDQAGETARAWLRCDNLAAGVNYFFVYYGNSSAPSLSDYSTTLDQIGEIQKNITTSANTWSNNNPFTNAFTSTPVVVAHMQTRNSSNEAHTRVRNISTTDFDVAVESSRTITHSGSETIGWIAMLPGSWMIGDMHVEAGTQANVDEDAWRTATFANNFSAPPGVIAVQQTANISGSGTNDYTKSQVRLQSIGANSFQIRIEPDDDASSDYDPSTETIGYIAADLSTFDTSLPNLKGQMQQSTVETPNVFYYEWIDITSSHTAAPVVLPTIGTANAWLGTSAEDTSHSRIKSVTTSRFQLQLEECDDCTEGHAFEDVSWLAMDSGLIWGHDYADPMPSAAVDTEQVILYSSAAPTIEPATDGEQFDGLAGFYELEGFENVGNIRYQITNDAATSTFYWYNGANWATATVGNTAQANNAVDVNDYLPLFDVQYGTGTFFFKAYLISDGYQLVQVDGIGIVERSELLSNYNWATDTTPPPIFFGDYVNAGVNPNQEYLLAIQIEHDGATGTYNFQLQYQEDPYGTPGAWTNISAASAKWKAVNGTWGAHNDPVLVADFANSPGTGAAINGVYAETGIVNTYEFASGQYYSEFWYAIMPDATTANKEYRFRVVNGSSSANFAYRIYPKTGPPPDPITLTINAPYISAGIKYTDDPVLGLEFTCTDQPFATYGLCDAADGMRLGCSLLGVNSVATQSYVITPPDYNFDLGAQPLAAACDSVDGQKVVYFQAENDRTYLQVNPATDTVILDTVAPDMSTATLEVFSAQEDYFKGTNDGVTCDAGLSPACTAWFNSNVGQGAWQILYVRLDAAPGGNIDQNPDSFKGGAAFNDNPAADTSPVADWLVDNYSVEAGHGDELGVVFTFTDKVTKTDTFTIDYQVDNESPDTIAPAQVTAWDAAAQTANFSYYQWINYPNPYFEWADPADRPYGALQNSEFWRYQSWLSTDPTFVPSTYTLANFLEATGPLQNGYQYYVIVRTHDYVTNASTPTVSYAFRYDSIDPIFDYNDPATGAQTIWYSQDPGAAVNIDVLWSSGSPLVDYNYRINAGAWQNIFTGSQSSDYTNDWALNWALLPEGANDITLSAHDEATNGATETYVATTSGFQFRKDVSAPDDPATPVNAWDVPAKTTVFVNGGTYNVPQPYFEWAPPADNPAGVDTVDNAGVAGYYVAMSTDPAYVPASSEYQTAATHTAATAALECTTYYLRIRTRDNASPPNVSTPTITAFQYLYSQAPVITNNQAGDNTWWSANPGAIYDVDFDVNPACVGNLDWGQYKIHTALLWGGALVKDWTNFYGPAQGGQSYSAAWGIAGADWALLPEGLNNQISVRANDTIGSFVSYATDVFYIRKDVSAPDQVAIGTVGGWKDDTKTDAMVSGGSYDYANPYFEWAAPDDNPNPGTAMNAGVAFYYATVSTNAAADPSADPNSATVTTEAYYATPSACGATYSLIISTVDAATPTPNMSAPIVLFQYYYECKSKPDYFVLKAEEDGAITEDETVTDWCAGGACTPACVSNYCSNTAGKILAKPEYVKYNDGGLIQKTLTNEVNNVAAGNERWSWDTANNRIMLFNDPALATVTYTPNAGSEKVCVYIYDSTDSLINTGKYASADFVMELSQAPASGSDITENLSSSSTGYTVINNIPGGDIDLLNTTYIGGTLKKGVACVRLTADSVPNDSPQTPLRVDGTLIDPDTSATMALTLTAGATHPALIKIRQNIGVSATGTSFNAVTEITDIWNPDPNDPDLTITLNPVWGFGGDRVAFVSRQNNPCSGAAAAGNLPYQNFNIYIRTYNAGAWADCVRLTSNTTDGFDFYGPHPASEITFTPDDSKIVFSGTDIGVSGADKLFWVSATAPVLTPSLGSQVNIAVSDPLAAQSDLDADASVGDITVSVGFLDPTFAVGQQVVIGDLNTLTGKFDNFEVKTIAGLGVNSITFDTVLAGSYSASTANTYGTVQLVTFAALGQNISPMADESYWYDPAWSPDETQNANCMDPPDPAAGRFGDALAVVRWSPTGAADYTGAAGAYAPELNNNPNIIMLYGAKAGTGASQFYQHDTSDIAKITNFSGNTIQPLKPKWSPDCSKLAFLAWDKSVSSDPSQTSVYVINLTDVRPGWDVASLPVTSLTATGVYMVYDYNSRNMPAYFPNWSADSQLVSFSLDNTNSLNLLNVSGSNDAFVSDIYSGVDFDSYLEYIEDQPNALGGIIGPQIIGTATSTAGMRNEFGMAQCPGNLTGSTCPENPGGSGNFSFTFVSQTSGSSGALQELTLDNVSTVTNDGGLLFLDGMVTAVFPPGVVSSDTVFWNEWPTQYCLGAGPASQSSGGGAGNCPVEPTGEYIVNTGDAREFFPDGTNFEGYVRMVFHYCDNDDDGMVDANTEGTEIAGFTFNSGTGQCLIGALPTSGGTIDADSLAVYNWDDAAAQWVKLEGTVDKVNHTITVYSTHFSRYDTFGFRTGAAPPVITPLQLPNVHTYPNPWRTTDGVPLKFAADSASGDGSILVDIKIYDVRGSLVASVSDMVPNTYPAENGGVTLASWGATNQAGRSLASGVYLYYLHATDTANGTVVTKTGKLSIIH